MFFFQKKLTDTPSRKEIKKKQYFRNSNNSIAHSIELRGHHFIDVRVMALAALPVVDPLLAATAPLEVELALAVCDSLARWAAIVRDKTRERILSSGSIAPRCTHFGIVVRACEKPNLFRMYSTP